MKYACNGCQMIFWTMSKGGTSRSKLPLPGGSQSPGGSRKRRHSPSPPPPPPPSECQTSQPYSQKACEQASQQAGLKLGGHGYSFSGKYSIKGCYAYTSGKYKKIVFYGTGGTEAQMKASPGRGKMRPAGYDQCGGGSAAPPPAPPPSPPPFIPRPPPPSPPPFIPPPPPPPPSSKC